ncbi:MAG: hypothetical protein EOO41_05205, partial [Methanobacteriota archaeon]
MVMDGARVAYIGHDTPLPATCTALPSRLDAYVCCVSAVVDAAYEAACSTPVRGAPASSPVHHTLSDFTRARTFMLFSDATLPQCMDMASSARDYFCAEREDDTILIDTAGACMCCAARGSFSPLMHALHRGAPLLTPEHTSRVSLRAILSACQLSYVTRAAACEHEVNTSEQESTPAVTRRQAPCAPATPSTAGIDECASNSKPASSASEQLRSTAAKRLRRLLHQDVAPASSNAASCDVLSLKAAAAQRSSAASTSTDVPASISSRASSDVGFAAAQVFPQSGALEASAATAGVHSTPVRATASAHVANTSTPARASPKEDVLAMGFSPPAASAVKALRRGSAARRRGMVPLTFE